MEQKKTKTTPLNRCLTFTREQIDEDSRTLSFSFSSEEPVERYFGMEILDHSPKSVRLKRLKTGGPLLLDHDRTKQIGVIESVSIGDDRRGHVSVRFGKSAQAEEVYADVLDGIRSNVSVGYMIHRMSEEGDRKNPVMRATDWEPYEVSLVSIPADFSVGVGRDLPEHETIIEREESKMSEETKPVVEPKIDTKKIEQETRDAEMKRVKAIRELGKKWGCESITDKAIEDGLESDKVRDLVFAEVEKRNVKIDTEVPKPEAKIEVGMRYDRKALKAWEGSKDPERDAYISGRWAQAVLFGSEKSKRWLQENGYSRVMNEGVGSEGGFAVPDELESGIINLRNEYGKVRQLARVYPMGTASLMIPKRTSGATAYFLGEESATTASDIALGQVELVAKELSALTLISKSLAEDSIIDIAALVADEQAYAFAVKEDECWINGDGTSTYGGITGLVPLFEGTTATAGRVTTTSGDDTFPEIISSDLDAMMAKLPSYAKRGAVWLASPTADALVFGRLLAAAGGNTIQTLNGSTGMSYLGYMRELAEPCPAGAATDYTSKAMLFFGNFMQTTAMGERRGLTVQVLNERYAEYRQIGIISTERIALVNHGVGDTTNPGSVVCLYGNS